MSYISFVELEVCDFGFGLLYNLMISDVFFFFHFAEFFISTHFDVDASRHFVLSSTPLSTCSQVSFFQKKQTRFCEAKYEVSPLFAEPLE